MVSTRLSPAIIVAAVLAAMFASTAPALAQEQLVTKPPVPHQQVVSANPFGLMLRWWNVEFERRATASSTWGVSASFLGAGGFDFATVNGLYRYYPQGAALSGVFLGARAGIYRGQADDSAGHTFGAGFEVGYTWLLGSRRNVGLSLGAGLTRLFGGDLEDGPAALPNIRLLNVGIAF